MTADRVRLGLTSAAKTRLLGALADRSTTAERATSAGLRRRPLGDPDTLRDMHMLREAGEMLGVENPFFRLHDGLAGATSSIGGREVRNFTSYNYLGLNGHPEVSAAAKAAIDRYGTSVSGSRIVSGERPVHRALETTLAAVYQAEDCVTFVSGHATNVTVIGHLVGAGDAVVYDALSHNSIIQGALLSGAIRRSFAHNDLDDLDRALAAVRGQARRILVVVEGHYSMDGDLPNLPALLPVVRRHGAYLMVDEAHSLGVLGPTGLGVAEHYGVDPRSADLWMGTLSKTLASCGGYVAGSAQIVDYLRCTAPGFLYSVGMPAPAAAAALAALKLMLREPERVARLQENSRIFQAAARAHGLDTGEAVGAAIVPIMIGSSIRTALTANALWLRGVNVQPIQYPGVPERTARLRFFISAEHQEADLVAAAQQTAEALAEAQVDPDAVMRLAAQISR